MSDDDAYKPCEGCPVFIPPTPTRALALIPPVQSVALSLLVVVHTTEGQSAPCRTFFFSWPLCLFIYRKWQKVLLFTCLSGKNMQTFHFLYYLQTLFFSPLVTCDLFFSLFCPLQICVLLFACLYIVCYFILTHFKKTAEFVTGGFGSQPLAEMLGGELKV